MDVGSVTSNVKILFLTDVKILFNSMAFMTRVPNGSEINVGEKLVKVIIPF